MQKWGSVLNWGVGVSCRNGWVCVTEMGGMQKWRGCAVEIGGMYQLQKWGVCAVEMGGRCQLQKWGRECG